MRASRVLSWRHEEDWVEQVQRRVARRFVLSTGWVWRRLSRWRKDAFRQCSPFLPAVACPNGWNGNPRVLLWLGWGFPSAFLVWAGPGNSTLREPWDCCPDVGLGCCGPLWGEAAERPAQTACVIPALVKQNYPPWKIYVFVFECC